MKLDKRIISIVVLILTLVLVTGIVLLSSDKDKSDQTFDNYVEEVDSEHPLYKDVTNNQNKLINDAIDDNIDKLYELGITSDMLDSYTLTFNNGTDKIIIEYNVGEYQVYVAIKYIDSNIEFIDVFSTLNEAS